MLVEVISNQTTTRSESDSTENIYARMERPKSAKYNLERYKKASAHASRFNRAQNCSDAETHQAEVRYQASKSAYVGRLRPKSARHNMDRYRQEAVAQEEVVDAEEDDLDDLEGLLIGEEDSASELDSDSAETRKKNKTKLLSRRVVNARLTVGPQIPLNTMPNKTSNLNTYTTFRPTAVTTNYSTSLKVVHLHPDKENESLDQTNGSINTTTTTNSSSSSSSSSSKQLQPVLQEHIDNTDKNRFKNSHIEATSRDLLNDWLKKDDDVDLNVKNEHDDFVIDENLIYSSKYQKNAKSSRFARGPISGRTTRSDYSTNSNFSHTKTSDSSAFYNREKSNLSDPWTKRNPTLIAQNVLLKHRAELEQISAANRANNTSRTSNTPSLLSHTTNNTNNGNTFNRCLLPDTKYFKK